MRRQGAMTARDLLSKNMATEMVCQGAGQDSSSLYPAGTTLLITQLPLPLGRS